MALDRETRVKIAGTMVKLAERLIKEAEEDKTAQEIDEIVASETKEAETLRQNPKLPQLNSLTTRVVDKITDRKMLFEFVVMILKRKGEEAVAKRILPILKQFLNGDEEIETE